MIYNKNKTIRTSHGVEKCYSTSIGFIGRVHDVEYLQPNGQWGSVGSRWLINEMDIQMIIENGFKSAIL